VQSDLDNNCTSQRVPMLAFFGFPSAAEEVSAGPGEAIAFPAEGKAEYIEPKGTSFDYQFKRLEQIAAQINELGLSAVLGQKLSAETAEAKRIDRSQGDSTMMVIAQNVQDMIDNCLQYHAQYLGQAAAAGSCYVNRDFIGARLEPQEIQSLLQLYTAGTITQETLLRLPMRGLIYRLLDWITDRLVDVMIRIDPMKDSRKSTLDYTVSVLPDNILAIVRVTWYKDGRADEVDQVVMMEDGQNGYDAFAALVTSSLNRGANVSIRSGYAPQDLGII
jgi:hypothetical protein